MGSEWMRCVASYGELWLGLGRGWLRSQGLRTRGVGGAGGARCARGARRAGGARGQLCHKSSQHGVAKLSRWTRATRQAHPHRVGSNCRRRGCIAPLRALLGTGIRLQRARPTRLQRLAGIANAVVLPLGGRDRRNGCEHTNRNAARRAVWKRQLQQVCLDESVNAFRGCGTLNTPLTFPSAGGLLQWMGGLRAEREDGKNGRRKPTA